MIIDFIIEDLMLNSYLQKNFHTLLRVFTQSKKSSNAFLRLYVSDLKETKLLFCSVEIQSYMQYKYSTIQFSSVCTFNLSIKHNLIL